MPLDICIIHANCQGDPLHRILASTPAFAQRFTIRKYTNYLEEHIADDYLGECKVLLYQQLSDKWNDAASSALLARLPLGAQALRIPNMFFKGYWPLWTNKTFMAYGDIFLEYLAQQDITARDIVHLCKHAALPRMYDLDGLVQSSVEIERDKELGCVVETVNLVQELWKKEQLFTTVNHPAARLTLHVADGVLRALGLGNVPDAVRKAIYETWHDDFVQPIFPQVAQHFGFGFMGPDRDYTIYGRTMPFTEYCQYYIACKREKIPDFAAFMNYVGNTSTAPQAA